MPMMMMRAPPSLAVCAAVIGFAADPSASVITMITCLCACICRADTNSAQHFSISAPRSMLSDDDIVKADTWARMASLSCPNSVGAVS